MHLRSHRLVVLLASVAVVAGLQSISFATAPQTAAAKAVVRLATTTSTADTGLLTALLPDFERQCNCRVDVVAVGTGQALELGRRGDVDVLLVHDREAEIAFLNEGHATRRDDVMYNDFVIVGPTADPAGVAGAKLAIDAFKAIAKSGSPFASRGDKSGTHTKELALWKLARLAPDTTMPWYLSVGQGMGETLTFASERKAYALCDRATWLALKSKVPALAQLFGGATLAANPDRDLRNDYGIIAVGQAKHPNVQAGLAAKFIDWILSKATQERIGAFAVDRIGQSLFYPNSEELKATASLTVQVGAVTKTLALAELKALPKVRLANHEVVGVKRGKLGKFTWTGASLADILKAVDPTIADPKHRAERIVLTSSDKYAVTVKWTELFGHVPAGERAYLAKGCNECHGTDAEGTAPAGKRPAPMLVNRAMEPAAMAALVRDPARHAGIGVLTKENIADADIAAMIEWLKNPAVAPAAGTPADAAARRVMVLAYERDGQPLKGRDGLIQFVVGSDEFASRYSHWVASIAVR